MRYIDADKVTDYFKKKQERMPHERTKALYECFIIMIEHQPTADVKPVVRGRNITDGHPVDGFLCSECGFGCEGWSRVVYDEEADEFYFYEYEFKFCPNCGAEMRGEKE